MVLKKPVTWPRPGPVYQVFPTLQRFKPTLRARCMPRAQPGASFVPVSIRELVVQHLYHDLGVCVYAGASVKQVRRIAKVLEETTANGQSQADLRIMSLFYRQTTKHRSKNQAAAQDVSNRGDVEKDNDTFSYSKYRLATEDRHIDYNTLQNSLSIEAFAELATKAASRWISETVTASQKAHPELDVGHIAPANITITRGLFTKGILHHTVNGARRLNIDAHCLVSQHDRGFRLAVEMYTVGTGEFLGKLFTDLYALDHEGYSIYQRSKLVTILEAAPRPPASSSVPLESATQAVFDLERNIWSHRVDTKMYPGFNSKKTSKKSKVVEQSKKSEKPEQLEQSEQSEQSEKFEQSERSEQSQKSEPSEKLEKPE